MKWEAPIICTTHILVPNCKARPQNIAVYLAGGGEGGGRVGHTAPHLSIVPKPLIWKGEKGLFILLSFKYLDLIIMLVLESTVVEVSSNFQDINNSIALKSSFIQIKSWKAIKIHRTFNLCDTLRKQTISISAIINCWNDLYR